MVGSTIISPSHQCPRCDYDLSGQIASWQSECPLAGQCPECGLTFTWSNHFNTQPPPTWSFEHANGPTLSLALALLRSLARAIFPESLWRSLTMSFPIVPKRLLLLATLGSLFLHLFVAIVTAVGVTVEWALRNHTSIAAIKRGIFGGVGPELLPSLQANWSNIAFPYASISRARGFSLDANVRTSELHLVFFLALPLSFLLLAATMRRAKVRMKHLARVTAYWIAALPLGMMTFPFVRRAQQVLSVVHQSTSSSPNAAPPSIADFLAAFNRNTPLIALALITTFSWLFWSTASKHYLHLPRARLDSAILVVVALCVAFASQFLMTGMIDPIAFKFLWHFYPR